MNTANRVIPTAVQAIIARHDSGGEGGDGKLDAVLSKLDSALKRMDDDKSERDKDRDEARKDRARLDDVCSRMDSIQKRYDDAETARKDADEKERQDKARKDAEAEQARKDAEAEQARKDAEAQARKDAQATAAGADDVRKRLDELQRQLPAQLSAEDREKFSASQQQAHKVSMAFGDADGAPPPLNGETLPEYRRRLLRPYKQHSQAWKDVDLTKINDEAALAVAETQIYADAQHAADHPTGLGEGVLIQRSRTDQAGRVSHTFVGNDEGACWRQFMFPMRIFGDLRRASRE